MNPLILNILRERCSTVPISYRDFIELALYHPQVGYYSTNRSRVGPSRNNDFYTAESLGTVFSQLVIDSARSHLAQYRRSFRLIISLKLGQNLIPPSR